MSAAKLHAALRVYGEYADPSRSNAGRKACNQRPQDRALAGTSRAGDQDVMSQDGEPPPFACFGSAHADLGWVHPSTAGRAGQGDGFGEGVSVVGGDRDFAGLGRLDGQT